MTSAPEEYLLEDLPLDDDLARDVAEASTTWDSAPEGPGLDEDQGDWTTFTSTAPSTGASPQQRKSAVARLLTLLRRLAAADAKVGVRAPELVMLGGYPKHDRDSAMAALQRDLGRLRDAGWQIQNVAPAGSTAQYVLRPNEMAHRTGLTPGEQSALEAALAAQAEHAVDGPTDSPPAMWAEVRYAVDRHCVIEMTYKAKLYRVHPMRLHNPPGRWLLRAKDDRDSVVKWFLIHRIEMLSLEDPGTAETGIDDSEDSLNPHRWAMDAPVQAELLVEHEHVVHVRQTLHLPIEVHEGTDLDRVTVTVTNRRALYDWLVTMGLRVRLVGPDELRNEFLDRLEAVADA